jgi:mannose-6-phosphate isomerase-like protein (cupin superfamily)
LLQTFRHSLVLLRLAGQSSAMRMHVFAASGVLAAILAGCAPRPPRVAGPTPLAEGVDGFLAAHPLAAAPVRVDLLLRGTAASWHVVQARRDEPPHRHAAHDLTVVVLRGRGTLHRPGARDVVLDAGDVAVVPRGEIHWFAPDGVAVALVAYAPPLDAPDMEPVDMQEGRR